MKTFERNNPSLSEKDGVNPMITAAAMDDMPGREEELRRNRNSKIFNLGQNLYQAILYPDPVHYQDKATGAWKEIDNRLVKRSRNGTQYLTNRDNSELKARFFPANQEHLVQLENSEGAALAWSVHGCETVSPVAKKASRRAYKGRDVRRKVLSKTESEAIYTDIFPGVDLRCRLQGISFKDEFIFHTQDSLRPISLSVSAPHLKLVKAEDETIDAVTAAGEVVFTLPAAFTKDAAGTIVPAVLRLNALGNDLFELQYDVDATGAVYPVVLDPAVITRQHSSAIEDNFVTSAAPAAVQPYNATNLRVSGGSSSYGKSKAFIKFLGSDLPAIDSSYYVTKAYLSVAVKAAPTNSADVVLKEVLGDWNSQTITYNNQPPTNEKPLDFVYIPSGVAQTTRYTYDISNLVRKWYAGTNYGVVLETDSTTYMELFSSDNAYNKPYAAINYISLAGLESFLAYDDQNIGRAGVGHIGLYNGNLIFEHQDTQCTGNLMPLSIAHVYNSCYHNSDGFNAGNGWMMSLQRTLHKEYLPGTDGDVLYYVLTDGDGTRHHFQQISGEWRDLSGLDLKLTITGSTATIKDKADNSMVFDLPTALFNNNYANVKMLKSLTDARGNTATITTNASRLITQAVDGAGRSTAFTNNTRVLSITAPGYGKGVSYAYNSTGQLVTITDPDGKSTTFTYNSLGLLATATNHDGKKVAYEYYTAREPYRIKKVTVSNSSMQGDSKLFEYGDCLTIVTDLTVTNGKKLYYHFNDYGNLVSVNDQQGYGAFTQFTGTNKPLVTSNMRRSVCNLLKNHNFEMALDWTFTSATAGNSIAYATDNKFIGMRSVKATIGANLGEVSVNQALSLQAGKTYTLSFYARRTININVWAKVVAGGSTFTSPSLKNQLPANIFTRVSYSFTMPANVTSATVSLCAGTAQGTAWFDCVQLEEGAIANSYNLLLNGDFSFNSGAAPSNWTANPNNTSQDAVYTSYTGVKPEGLSAHTMRLYGGGRTKKGGIYQDIPMYGSKGDVFVVGGWSMNYSAPRKGNDKRYGIRVSFSNVSTASKEDTPSILWSEEWSGWQFAAGAVVAPCQYSGIRINIDYEENLNYAEFDGMFLYKEQFGASYVYDVSGNVTTATTAAGQKAGATYDAYNNLISYYQPGRTADIKTTYAYQDIAARQKHLPWKIINPMQVNEVFTYDDKGNPTVYQVQNPTATTFIKNTTAYTSDKNYIASKTDSRGNTTLTNVDAQRGTLTSCKTPNGLTANYLYDLMNRPTSVTAVDGKTYKIEYVYSGDYISQLKHNTTSDGTSDVIYGFTYDALGNPLTVKLGSQTLYTNVYTASGDRLLNEVQYGNGQKVTLRRDSFKRVIAKRYDAEGTDRYQYAYGANGEISRIVDAGNNRTTTYEYDASGRRMQTKEMEGASLINSTRLSYDQFNNISGLQNEVNGIQYETTITYNNANKPTTLQFGGTTNKVTFNYDVIGRVASRAIMVNNKGYATSFVYTPGGYGANSSTPLVKTMTQAGHVLNYTYDNMGRISSTVYAGKTVQYLYDKLGQLTRVNDQIANVTWTYAYDRGGNMTQKQKYAYTTGNLGTAQQTINYAYGDTNWKDKLTAYNGASISCDAIGNTTNDGAWTYRWEAGRQLAGMTKTGTSIAFKYAIDGSRIKKIVGSTATDYYLHGKKVIHQRQGTNNLHFYYDSHGRVSHVSFNNVMYGYVQNVQGDIIAIIDAAGTSVVQYNYDAWGKPISKSGTLASTLGTQNPFRYRGYVYDEETGLYYIHNRYYNPEWGRFINADSVISSSTRLLGQNAFAYCCNNPVNFYDKSGNSAGDCQAAYFKNTYFMSAEAFAEYLKCQYERHPTETTQVPLIAAIGNAIGLAISGKFSKASTFRDYAAGIFEPFFSYNYKTEGEFIKYLAEKLSLNTAGYKAVMVELLYGSHSAEMRLSYLDQDNNFVTLDGYATQGYEVILDMMDQLDGVVEDGGIKIHEHVGWKDSMIYN